MLLDLLSLLLLAASPEARLDPLALATEEGGGAPRGLVEVPAEPSNGCPDTGYESFEGLDREPVEERGLILRAAEAAVRSSTVPACKARVAYIDPWPWNDVRLFRISRGSCWSLSIRMIAVDADGRTFELAADDRRSPAEALADFNSLTAGQDVEIQDEQDAKDYLEFFLGVFLQRAGGYVPSKRVADLILDLTEESAESELLRDGVRQIEKPVVEVLGVVDGRYRAQSFNWFWWYGGMKRFDLEVDGTGRVSFHDSEYGYQRTLYSDD